MGKIIGCNLNSVLTSHWKYDTSLEIWRSEDIGKVDIHPGYFKQKRHAAQRRDESITSIFKKEQGNQCSWGKQASGKEQEERKISRSCGAL